MKYGYSDTPYVTTEQRRDQRVPYETEYEAAQRRAIEEQ